MVREILNLEERVGEEYVIRQHGTGPIDREDRLKVGGNTYPMESRIFKKQYKTGGISHKPALNRLARMQSTYVVCKRISNEAISKHDRALPAYIERVNEFARLMGQEIDSARALLPPEDKEEE